MPNYDAFISYSHAKDKPIASALHSVIQKLGKPWYQRRALRVFRDDTSLSATPNLWPTIEQALGQSRYFVLLASPEAAASKWVSREVAHWLDRNSVDTLLIGVTSGALFWDEAIGDFAEQADMPLPPVLAGRFITEPKWVDLRAYRDSADKGDAKFTELAADFAAAIRGMPKEDLLSQEVRQQRRALTLAWSAAALLFVLAGAASWELRVALKAEREATEQKQTAETATARAERNFGAAKSTVDSVVFDLVTGLRNVEGLRAETARRILERAETAVNQLASRTENDLAVRRSQVAMFDLFSDIYLSLGAADLAMTYAQNAVQIGRELATKNADNPNWLSDLSVSLNKVGNVLRSRSDFKEALLVYRESLDIVRGLIAKQPDNTVLRNYLSHNLNNIGDVLVELGDLKVALDSYSGGLQIKRDLSAKEPDNTQWRRDEYVSLTKVANVLSSQGIFKDALALYREGIVIARDLSSKDPDNTLWRRDVTISLERIGDALLESGDLIGTQAAYAEALESRREQSRKDPGNMEWRRDLMLSLIKVCLVSRRQNNLKNALIACREALDMARDLSAADPENTRSKLDVASSLEVAGMVLLSQGDLSGALAAHQEELALERELVAKEPSNTQWQRHLSVGLTKVGTVLDSLNHQSDALSAFRESLDIVRHLASTDPTNAMWQTDIVISLDYLARVGDDPHGRWMEALSILSNLRSQNRLTPEQSGWIGRIEGDFAKLGLPSSDLAPMVEQIEGTYVGTNAQTRSWGSSWR